MNTITQLKNSADLIKRIRPSYKDILGFYTHVFEAQELCKSDIGLDPLEIDDTLLSLKKDADMPLVDPSQFKVDMDSATKLMITICDLAQEYAPNLSSDAKNIKNAVESNQFEPDHLFSAILENRDSIINEISETINVPEPQLILFGYHSLVPSITAGAQQLSVYLGEDHKHLHGYCPICGNQPDLAILDDSGKKSLKCSFCNHQWAIKRMGCTFCNNLDPEKQQYFYSDEEKEYRVDLCESCKNYIKVVDLRQMNRFFYPGLESIATLHLDMKAKEKGYVNKLD